MRIRHVTILTAIVFMFAAAPAAAQVFCIPTDDPESPDLGDFAACAAATNTPFGALPTNVPGNWLGRTTTGIGFNVRFGTMNEEGDAGRRNLGVGLELPVGRTTIGLTGGFVDYTCDTGGEEVECKNAIMLGGDFRTPLVSTPFGGETGQASFFMGLVGSVGFSTGDIIDINFGGDNVEISGRGFSLGLGLPLGMVARSGTATITPFIEPAFFWGQTKLEVGGSLAEGDNTESGTGFALGGGVSFGFANGLALSVGFKKVMVDEANALIGLGISFQR